MPSLSVLLSRKAALISLGKSACCGPVMRLIRHVLGSNATHHWDMVSTIVGDKICLWKINYLFGLTVASNHPNEKVIDSGCIVAVDI